MNRGRNDLQGDQRGLSLIELLVALAVFALLFLMVDGVFISAHRSARKAELGANVQQNGRIAIDRLTREIRETELSDIRIAADGSWVAFKSARLPGTTAFCIDVTSGPLYNGACNPTGNTYTPVWQRWIVFTYDSGAGVLRREVQAMGANPTTPGAGDDIATSVRVFDARCPGSSAPYLAGETFCVSLEVEGREVVQGSQVPPQQISLVSRVEIRNE